MTYKNARRAPEVVAVTPLDRIVVETDAPYMSPVPNRGRRNDSRNLPYIVEKLAEWKGISPEEMAAHTWNNGLRLFGLEGRYEKSVSDGPGLPAAGGLRRAVRDSDADDPGRIPLWWKPMKRLLNPRRSLFQPRLPNPRRQPPRRNPSPPPPW